MKFFSFIASLSLILQTLAFHRDQNIPITATPEPTMPPPVECSMEVCFAIEGSNMINQRQFDLQKEFIARFVETVEATSPRNDVKFAAAQYGVDNEVISFLTSDTTRFLNAVERTTFRNTDVNFVSGGIIFCHRDLFTTGVENGAIVLLGTGRATFGGDPVEAARIYGGKILTVGVGNGDRKTLLEIVGGDRNRRLALNRNNVRYVVSRVLQDICKLEDRKSF